MVKSSIKYICACMLLLSILSACVRDHLYYSTSAYALVRIDIDWSESALTPNGVSAYIFNNEQGAYYDTQISSNPNSIDLHLPKGQYNVVLFNNTITELPAVALHGAEFLSSFLMYAQNAGYESAVKSTNDAKVRLVKDPNIVAVSTIDKINITEQMTEYYPEIPDHAYETEVEIRYNVTPKHITSIADVNVNVKGLIYAAGAPRALLRNVPGGYIFSNKHTILENVMHEFVLNNRKFYNTAKVDGTISKEFDMFGLHTERSENNRYYLDIRFILLDKRVHLVSVDVTDKMEVLLSGKRKRIKIEVDIELPEAETPEGGGDDDEGSFDPSLDPWTDIDVALPM